MSYYEKYDILIQFEWIIANNKGSINPYHNNSHIESVTLFAIKGCEHYKIEHPFIKLVGTAALFHDFNHTGGVKEDIENIRLANQGYLEFNKTHNIFTDEESKIILSLINETIYPHTKHSDYLTLTQNILRDSDTLQGFFQEDYLHDVVEKIGMESNLSLNQMIKNQIHFLNSLEFGTEWAVNEFNNIKPLIIKKIEEYGNI